MPAAEALTFEKVWAMFQETREQMKETDRRFKETSRQIGQLGNRFGELAEHLVAPIIKEKFNELGFMFEQISQNHQISDASKHSIAKKRLLF